MDDLQDPARALNELDDVLAAMRYNENRSAQIGDLAKKHGISESQVRHVLDGDIKKGSGSGGQVRSSPNIRVSNPIEDPQTGLIRADIEVYNVNSGRFHAKGALTTFFPDWEKTRVLGEINEAFANSARVTGEVFWEGTSSSGVKIQGHYDDAGSWATGWPKS